MRPGRAILIPLILVSCGNPSDGGSDIQTLDPLTVSLSEDLGTLKTEVASLGTMIWSECSENCNPIKNKKLIKVNKVNSSKLENQIWGVEVDRGYSWDKYKYFGDKTLDDFLQAMLKGNTLKFNLDKLCALKEIIPLDNGKFVAGLYNLAEIPAIQTNCNVLFADLNLGATALVEGVDEGGYDQKITLDEDVLYLKVSPDVFSFGLYSSSTRRRLTYDKIKNVLSVETLRFLPGQDSLVRVFYDGVMGKACLLTKEVDPEEIEIAYSAEMGMLTPRFAKLDIKSQSLGGVEDESPEAKGCIDLARGLVSQYSYEACPINFGFSLDESNPALLEMNYTPSPDFVEVVEFVTEDDVFLKGI
ncbi:MAG: hypothetical protein DRQ88_03625 [Epsilonproteobacteria bacterium]|nr:MAG: hypothetical protein DRQ89_03865 [Campylobacterota bacterium]RLA67264.1 MAG: hypothetical protein DRQ88_03625 [Campylobacterota bacterium]